MTWVLYISPSAPDKCVWKEAVFVFLRQIRLWRKMGGLLALLGFSVPAFPSDWRWLPVTFCFPAQSLLCSSQAEINILQLFLYQGKFHLKQSFHNLVVPICHQLQVGHKLPIEFPGGEHACRCLGNKFHFSGLKIAHFFQHWNQLRREANTSSGCSGAAGKQLCPGRTQESRGPKGLGLLVDLCPHQLLAYSSGEEGEAFSRKKITWSAARWLVGDTEKGAPGNKGEGFVSYA